MFVTVPLTLVTDIVTCRIEPRSCRTRPGRHSLAARASAVPAGGLATRARAALGIMLSGTTTGARGAVAGLGQAGAGNARSKGCAKRVPATSQEAWPEAASLAMKDSLGREPRWNADRCAAPSHSLPRKRGRVRVGAAAVPVRRGRRALRLSAFRLRLFRSFLPVRSYPSVIRAEAALSNASTGIGLRQPGMEHRMKSVVTVQDSGVP